MLKEDMRRDEGFFGAKNPTVLTIISPNISEYHFSSISFNTHFTSADTDREETLTAKSAEIKVRVNIYSA